MILLTGAGGKTGKALLRALSSVERVCAFVHREEHVSAVKSLGAEKVVVGELRDETAIRLALQGVRTIYHVCPNMSPDETIIGNLIIQESRKAGVEHFVYHSVLHPQTQKMSHHWQKLHVEEIIFESGLPFTILQPAPYMQNIRAGWEDTIEDGVLRVPYSVDAKLSFIDLEDLAAAAKIVLTEPDHLNAIYELSGTLPMSHREVAEIFSGVLNRDVSAGKEEIRDWRLRVKGLSEYALENLVRMFEYYDRWGLPGNPNVLRWLLKREPTSWESFVQRTLKEGNAIH